MKLNLAYYYTIYWRVVLWGKRWQSQFCEKSDSRIWSNQSRWFGTLEYTPGYPSIAQPMFQDTTPSWNHLPSCWQTSGPPESPWKEIH